MAGADAGWVVSLKDGARLTLHIQPRGSKNAVEGVHGDALKVRLTAPPVEGAANEALIRFLAGELGVSRSALTLVSGATSRRKTVAVTGLGPDQVRARLGLGGG
ncbi:MAG: DUF167 domain-containing protein [Gemmatimonadales bacterium]